MSNLSDQHEGDWAEALADGIERAISCPVKWKGKPMVADLQARKVAALAADAALTFIRSRERGDPSMEDRKPGTTIEREGWFYLNTFLEGEYGDAHRRPEERSLKCTLLVRRAQLRRGPSGRVTSVVDTDAMEFKNEPALRRWIKKHDATQLPVEADGAPRYVPEGFRPGDVSV